MSYTMKDYILSVPNLVKENIYREDYTTKLEELYKSDNYKKIILVASGSSYHACCATKNTIREALEKEVEIYSPFNFEYYELERLKDEFIVVISQSGRSTNCINLLKKMKKMDLQTIVLTSDITSPISEYSDILINYLIDIESVGYVTRGYSGLVLFLLLFAINVSVKSNSGKKETIQKFYNDLEIFDELFKNIYEQSKEIYKNNIKDFLSMDVVHVISSGDSMGTAYEAALKIGETIKVPAIAYDLEEYIHGPNLQLTPNYMILFIDNGDLTSHRMHEIYKATKSITNKSFMITNSEYKDCNTIITNNISKYTNLLLNIIPFQLLAYEVTETLKIWDGHPLVELFNKVVNSKVDYK